MKVDGTGELELLKRIMPFLATQGFEIPAGEDDTAVWSDHGSYTVASCDIAVEGVHFDLGWMSAEDAGWRALALALGDLAAKGATPAWALTSVAVPKSWQVENFVGLYEGMSALAHDVGLLIVGGDMSSIDGPAVLSITVVGRTVSRPLARSQAKPGWAVAVTGKLGASALALKARQSFRLVPRIDEGRRLNQSGLCCGDISDGLLREMEKFAAASHAGCVLRASEIPLVDGASWEDGLTSGEEAELVCVGPEDLIRRAGLVPLGMLTEDPAVKVVGADGRPLQLHASGFDHFA
ncbi:MAG TPA: thiamine-phosphate kinase [Candidatus Micrarchaeaceae archaeon]|nr:thiamine-phosphate kinase [Candidatus Micrarchaeaceae archaeon]